MRVVVFLLDAAGDEVQLGLGLRRINAGLEPANKIRAVHLATAELVRRGLVRQPEIVCSQRELKALRQHTDNRVALAIDCQPASDCVRVAPKSSLPKSVIKNRDFWSIGLVLTRLERAAHDRIDTEHGKEVRAHGWPTDKFRLALTAEDYASAGVSGEPVKDVVLLVILIVGIGELAFGKVLFRSLLPQVIETIRRLVRQAAQQRGIDDRKDRRAAADAERERDHCYGHEPRPLE